ncbi:hypothetical protein [Vulgatibacter sp.]|uniref:hypothetical protein n=1 Tax=Vulgatibacter sp. TaxID=1971226 RepID=UPI0035646D38
MKIVLLAVALLLSACGAGQREAAPVPCEGCGEPPPEPCELALCTGPAGWEQTAGPVGTSRATALLVSGDTVLLGTWDVLLRSEDGGLHWEEAAGLPAGALSQLVEGARSIFAVVDSQHLYRSDDRGRSWRAIEAPGPIVSLAADGERLFAVIYEAAEERLAAVRSADGGASWTHLAPLSGNGALPTRIISGGDVLLAPGYGGQLLYRSFDGGASWEALAGVGYDVAGADAFGYHAENFFAVSQERGTIHRSADFGATWSEVLLGGSEKLSYQSSHLVGTPEGFFAALGSGYVYRWDVALDRWTPADDGLGPGFLTGFHGGDAGVFAVVEDRLLRFDRHRERWGPVEAELVRTRIDALAGGEGMLLARDPHGRLHVSADTGATWRRLEPPGEDAPPILTAEVAGGVLLAATAGGGVFASTDGGQRFTPVVEGFPTYQGIAGTQYREVAAFVDHEGSVLAATGSGFERTSDPWEPLQLTGAGVWRFEAGSWHPASSGLPSRTVGGEERFEPLVALASVEGALFAATLGNGLFRSGDGGGSWEAVGQGLPIRIGDDLTPVVELAGSGTILFARAGPLGRGGWIHRSTDGGLRFERFDPPEMPGAEAVALAGGAGEVAVAWRLAGGGWQVRCTTDGTRWRVLGGGMPNQPIRSLRRVGGIWYMGTEGGGVWRLAPEAEGVCGFPH